MQNQVRALTFFFSASGLILGAGTMFRRFMSARKRCAYIYVYTHMHTEAVYV